VNRQLTIVRDIKYYKEDSTINVADQFDNFTKKELVVPGKETLKQEEKVFVPPMFPGYSSKPLVVEYPKLKPSGTPEVPSSYVKFIDPIYEEK
jgi:hypothetical protein|tara:strand:- start:1935 stop:2213 length:279 start_codon:yes stop_codon:yes gene_type:complete